MFGRSPVELELLCCSWDGTVAFMGFDSKEIGKPLSTDEKVTNIVQNIIRKTYVFKVTI